MDNTPDYNDPYTNESDKKITRKEIERKRRQEMATLLGSLRSQLPLEAIKGKRSILDHVNAAVHYVKYQQNNIKELGIKRDELKKLSILGSGIGSSSHCTTSFVTVCPFSEGVKIVFSNDYNEERLQLSRVVKLLLEERLDVLSCVSTKVNEKLLHTIHCEVRDLASFNLSELEVKLNDVVIDP